MASKSLGTLTLDLVARVGGFSKGLSKSERDSAKWRNKVKRDLKETSREAQTRMKLLAGAFTGAAVAMAAMAVVGARNVDAQAKLARSLDTTFDSVTALQLAFGEAGVGDFERSMSRLNRRLGAAETGTGAAAKTVKALKLDLEELSNLEADERIARIADAIKDSGVSSAQAARYAQDLGFEQKEANQFFLQGGDAIRAYRKEVNEFGLALSAVETGQIESANDEFDKIGRAVTFVQQRLAVELAPAVEAVSTQITKSFKSAAGTMEDDIGAAVEVAVGGMADILDASATAIEFIQNNPMSAQFGLLGWVILGPKGALLGAAIGSVFEVVEEGLARIGVGISDAEDSARKLIGVQEDIAKQEEIIRKAREIGHDDNGRFVKEAQEQLVELREIESQLQAEVGTSTEAQEKYNEILNRGTTEAEGFAGVLRSVAESLRKVNENAVGAATAGLEEPEDEGVGGAFGGSGELEESLQKRLDTIRQAFETETQEILRLFGERDEEIAALEEERAISEMEANRLRLQNKMATEQAITDLTKDEADKRKQIEQQAQSTIENLHRSTWQSAANFLNTFAGESKAAALASIAITQGLAAAETLAHTQTASMLAFASQLVPGDPTSIARAQAASAAVETLGAVKIGIITATGLGQAASVLSGGGSVGTGGYSSSGSLPPASAPGPTDPTFSQDLEDDRRGVQIVFNGPVSGLDADQIARSIKDHLESTDFVLIEPTSRNGRALSTR